jgi:hypothetical protein
MKVTLLGCGTSVGVPALGHAGWGRCNPDDPRNRRQRCAVLIQTSDTTILVDAGPDIRQQLLPLGLKKIDAVLITHTHSDHIAGLDDLRAYYWPDRIDLQLHATSFHGDFIKTRFPYLFEKQPESPSYFVPPMKIVEIAPGQRLEIGDIGVDVFIRITARPTRLGSCSMICLPIRQMLSLWVMMSLSVLPVCLSGSSRRFATRRISRTVIMNRRLTGLIG